MEQYDYEWITKDINDSILIEIVQVEEDGNYKKYNSYQAIDVIDCAGNDVSVGKANVNDLVNLLTIGTMRFKGITNDEILDIPFRTLYKLYEFANSIKMEDLEIKIINRLLSFDELNAFTIINETIPSDNYKIIATTFSEPTDSLNKLICFARDYVVLGLDEKFQILKELNKVNSERIN